MGGWLGWLVEWSGGRKDRQGEVQDRDLGVLASALDVRDRILCVLYGSSHQEQLNE